MLGKRTCEALPCAGLQQRGATLRRLFLAPVLAAPLTASAAELVWDGHYRARGQFFNSLSLSDTNERAEGASALIDHRLRIQPGWLLSDRVGLFTQLDVLPYVLWGDEVLLSSDPALGDTYTVLAGSLQPPTTDEGGATLANIQVTRVYGELHTDVGTVRFGRMPLEWGAGMVLNAGNDPTDEFGDTADRVQFTGRAGQVYLQAGLETNAEQLVGEGDDVSSITGSLLYRNETAGAGLYNIYRTYSYDGDRFGMYTLDMWGEAQAGPLRLETELAVQIGRGDLGDGVDDASINAFGATLTGAMDTEQIRLGLSAGVATGDKDTTDKNFKTFTFDPDFNFGGPPTLFLFEEPMPVLEPTVKSDANGGRDYDAVRTGYAISNALYARPRVGWRFGDQLTVDLSYLIAQAAALPEDEADSKGYGSEIDLHAVYTPFAHFSLDGTMGLFLPGTYYSNYTNSELGGDFNQPAFGAQLIGTVSF